MRNDLTNLTWPAFRLGELLLALARRSGLRVNSSETSEPPRGVAPDQLDQWIESAAQVMGLEAEPVDTTYPDAHRFLRTAGPAILQLPDRSYVGLLGGGRAVSVIAPDLKVRRLPVHGLSTALCGELERPLLPEIERLLESAAIPHRKRAKVRAAILRERLRGVHLSDCWLLRSQPGSKFLNQLRRAGVASQLAALLGAHAAQYILWILSWWLIGRATLEGRLDHGWLSAWVLLLLTMVPLMLMTTWLQGRVAISSGLLLKQRLLRGALTLDPEEVRQQGAGQFLGRVMESQAVESLTLSGGFLALVSVVELIFALVVLLTAGAGVLLPVLLLAWIAISLGLAWLYSHRRARWSGERLAMTHQLVENMMGYRTRLVQEMPEHRHDGEDQSVERYLERSASMDRSATLFMAVVPRGWVVLGCLGIAPTFVSAGTEPAVFAIGLGGILLAYRALKKLSAGMWNLAGAAIAWRQVAPIFEAASRKPDGARPDAIAYHLSENEAGRRQSVIDAHELVFRYENRAEPALKGCSMHVSPGDRILLEGPSGGGKSTFGSLLMGLREPQSGLLLAGGLDRQSLGTHGWRRRVSGAPQFHENHVLTGTLAFNLLMGRRWPALPADLVAAEAVCRELGLGELLDRMPAGLLQTVGETGWQLSHGERSRVYIARALLEDSELIVLDESFAQLDPQNLRRALTTVLARARSLLVIAHP